MHEIEQMDGIVEYIESLGYNTTKREGNLVEIETNTTLDNGKTVYIVVEKDDIPALIGDVYRANTDVIDLLDKYVVERFAK